MAIFQFTRTRLKNGYVQFFDKVKRTWKFAHRVVAEKIFGTIPKGHHVHHIDHNRLNNSPSNLIILTKEAHEAYHRLNRRYGTLAPMKDNADAFKVALGSSAQTNFSVFSTNNLKSRSQYKPICTRCSGTGYLPQYRHVANGICFKCFGCGKISPDFSHIKDSEYRNATKLLFSAWDNLHFSTFSHLLSSISSPRESRYNVKRATSELKLFLGISKTIYFKIFTSQATTDMKIQFTNLLSEKASTWNISWYSHSYYGDRDYDHKITMRRLNKDVDEFIRFVDMVAPVIQSASEISKMDQ